MTLRSHLLRLVVAIAVPLLVFAGLVVFLFARQEHQAVERGLRDTAAVLALAIDRDIQVSIATLRGLATSDHLAAGDFRAFYEEARRVRAAHQVWPTVFLARVDGQEIFSLLVPFGAPLPYIGRDPDVVEAVRSGEPYVSNLLVGPVRRRPIVRVEVPVRSAGAVRYLLVATLPPQHITEILRSQPMSPEFVALVVDRNGTVVARSRDAAASVGRPVRPELLARTRAASHGFFTSTTFDRGTYEVAFSRVPSAAFVVAVGVPRSAVAGWSWVVAAICAVALAAALGFAVVMADRIRRPVLALASTARAVGRGEMPAGDGRATVEEVEVVRKALVEAAVVARDRAREHEERLAAEAAQREAEAAAATLESLVRITEEGLRHLTLDDLLHHVLVRLRLSLRADTATIFLLAEDGGTMTAVASDGLGPAADETVAVGLGGGVAGRIAATGEGLIAASVVGAALKLDDRVIGVVQLGTHLPRRFADADLVFVRLVADRVALAIEQARIHEAERTARGEAEAASRAKDVFLAMLGHELRNPLGTIANATHVLSRTATLGESATRARDIIRRQVAHLARLVDDLLDVSRVIAGKIVLDRRRLELADAVCQCVDGLRAAGRAGGRTVDVETEPVWVDADDVRLAQVIENLVTNALKYTPPGGRILVRVGPEEDRARLVVTDTGVGIPAEILPRIFDLFVQGDQSLDRPQGGLGLGLTLVRRLVELHGGTVEAASAGAGLGSTFTVRLPRAAPVASATSREAAGGDGQPDAHTAPPEGRRVLVIEDNADARAMLRALLEVEGHTVYEAADGSHGIQLALDHRVDVALVDVGLPGLDGYEVARRLRATPPGRSMVLVAVTGYGQSEDRQRAVDAGFDEHLVKPVEPNRLTAVLASRVR